MPNRIIREGFLDSERVNSLSGAAESFFVRLMLKADDYGRFTGHLSLLKASLFPLKLDRVKESEIESWVKECAAAGLIIVYEVEKKRFIEIPRFQQRTRAQKSRFPENAGQAAVICQSGGGHPRTTIRPVGDDHSTIRPVGSGAKRAGAVIDGSTCPEILPKAFHDSNAFREAWAGFVEHRVRIKAPLSKRAITLIANKVLPWGVEKAACALNQTVESGKWPGVYEPKGNWRECKRDGEYHEDFSHLRAFNPAESKEAVA